MKKIIIKVIRKIEHAHLIYILEGNFEPFPCGNLAEPAVKEYFTTLTKSDSPPKATEGYFFRLLLKEEEPTLWSRLYRKWFCDEKGNPLKEAPGKDISFIDLRPTQVIFHHLKDSKKTQKALFEEYETIQKILGRYPDSKEEVLAQIDENFDPGHNKHNA